MAETKTTYPLSSKDQNRVLYPGLDQLHYCTVRVRYRTVERVRLVTPGYTYRVPSSPDISCLRVWVLSSGP